ncbi:MAG: hypothetical protein FD165_2195 [Gammaproteobacteria bacterium]|nr:MAG: hypothetical protein FD165_2195 [Gammaproteobacteria bacterium]TND03281.1 MAG: hypothetical protein FD120_1954 [Gammaproteobacteria bacterium]
MKVPSPFEHFDPILGAAPTIGGTNLGYIATRARKILQRRDSAAVRYAMPTLNWILHQEDRDLIVRTITRKNEDASYLSPTLILRYQMQLFDISGQIEFPDATWPEYFAVLSLALVGNVYRPPLALRSNRKLSESEISIRFREYAGQLSTDAMEAICFAELLLEKTGQAAEHDPDGQIRIADSLDDVKTFEQREQLKLDFLAFFLAKKFKSFTDAAQAYLKQLGPEEKKAVQNSTAIATLADALRAFEERSRAFEDRLNKSQYP